MPTTEYGVDQFFQNAGTSPKMVYDVAGTLVWSPHNLQGLSTDLANASWTKLDVTFDNGSQKLTEGSTNGTHAIYNGAVTSTIISGEVYTQTVEVKSAGRTWVWIEMNITTSYGLSVNLATGAAGGSSGTFTQVITALADGWYRISMTGTANAAAGSILVSPALGSINTRTNYQGDGASGILLRNPQMNRGAVATAHLPTPTAARVGLALDYDPVTHAAKGLLCEPQATNLVVQSATGRIGFEWTGNSATYTGGQADPSGGNQALNVVVTSNASGNNVVQTVVPLVNGTTYVSSMWCKGTAGQQIYFDTNSSTSQKLITFTGSWQRVTTTLVAVGTNAFIGFECYNRSGGAHLPNVTFQIWGGQMEAGTVATSYIPTLAASVTRATALPAVTPASINYSATAGSWWVDIESKSNLAAKRIIGYQSGSGAAPIHNEGATSFGLFDPAGAYVSKTVPSVLGNHKVAIAFQAADSALTANGLAAGTSTGATTNTLAPGTTIGFGWNPIGAGAEDWNGYIRKIRYLPRRPSNAELQSMTT